MTNTHETAADYEYKSLTGQFNIDEALGIVECFAAGVGNKDSVGDICLPGCFTNSLKRRKPRVVWGHNWNEPIGKVLEIYEVGPNDPRLPAKMRKAGIGGLYARVQFNLKAERGREAFANVSFFGLEQEWSIGYKTLDAVFDPTQQANLLKEVELYEVSPVLHGANQLTGTISIKSDEAVNENKDGIDVKRQPLRDPKGGLTAAGRAHFKRTEGANLKPGVKGPADTPEKMRRKGSFLTRFFTNPSGPMKKPNGEPTRLALSAAAWGEPVPKNMEDAAKLAAKGRRLLERYSNTKKKDDSENSETKNHVNAIYEAMNSAENSVVGRAADLTRALASHFGGAVRLVNADNDIAIFEMGAGQSVETLRVAYHFDGDEFMFGTAQQVKPETVYIPVNGSNGSRVGESGVSSAMTIAMSPVGSSLYDAMSSAAVPHEACCDDCAKGETSCSVPNHLSTLEEFKSANRGEHLFLEPEDNAEKIEAFEIINTIAGYHSFDVKVLENGIVIPNIDKVSVAAYKALSNVLDSFEQKAIGSAIGRMPRNMNPATARDADKDRLVLEGIPTINRGRGVIDPTPGSDFDIPKAPRSRGKRGASKPRRAKRPGEADMPAVPRPVEVPEEIPEVVPVKPTIKPARPARIPEKVPEKIPEKVPERQPETYPVPKPGRVPRTLPEPMPVPRREPARQPERVPVPTRQPAREPRRTQEPMPVPGRAPARPVPSRPSGGPVGRMADGRRFPQEQRPVDMDTAEKVFNEFSAVSKNKNTKRAYEQVARKFKLSPRTVERYINEMGRRNNRDLPYVMRPEEAGVIDVDSPRGAMSSLPNDSNLSNREKRLLREAKIGRQIFLARENEGISVDEAASRFGVSRQKARQLELRHMSKLRGMDENSPNRVTRRMLDDPASTLSDEQTDLMKRRLD
jgi:HK97 family phage prohead protease